MLQTKTTEKFTREQTTLVSLLFLAISNKVESSLFYICNIAHKIQ